MRNVKQQCQQIKETVTVNLLQALMTPLIVSPGDSMSIDIQLQQHLKVTQGKGQSYHLLSLSTRITSFTTTPFLSLVWTTQYSCINVCTFNSLSVPFLLLWKKISRGGWGTKIAYWFCALFNRSRCNFPMKNSECVLPVLHTSC